MFLLKKNTPLSISSIDKAISNHPINTALLIFVVLLQSCKPTQIAMTFDKNKTPTPPQYADLKSWAAHPEKSDSADLIPAGTGLKDEQATAEVDVFYVHPTTYFLKKGDTNLNGDLNDEKLNLKTDNGAIKYQASVFNGVGRIYAPRYRQGVYQAFFPKTASDSAATQQAFELAYADVREAFEYYLKTWNKGRPIIIASHSQGTKHAGRLMRDFFDDKPLKNKLVMAYLVGMPAPKNYFKTIPPCDNPEQTGCFCSWRTFLTGHEPKFSTSNALSVYNPLSRSTAEGLVSNDKHKGGVMLDYKKTQEKLNDAQIHNGILWVSKPKFRGSAFYRNPNYHIADYNIFYMNVREDVKYRLGLFWKQ